jgi:hypothetical protein
MPQVIGKIPEFDSDGSTSVAAEEIKGEEVVEVSSTEAASEKLPEEEKETPIEPPATEKPSEESETLQTDDTGELSTQKEKLQREIAALETDRIKSLKELQLIRGQKRDFKREELKVIEEKLEDLKDIHPEDVKAVERILRSKGILSGADIKKMTYEAAANDVRDQFLGDHPEYKPENDPYDEKWSRLMADFELYRMPDNPKRIRELLERSHRTAVARFASERSQTKPEIKKRQVELASLGSGGGQRSSSSKILDGDAKEAYRRGGWSEEEIKTIEQNIPE